jgi:hypothetical protein
MKKQPNGSSFNFLSNDVYFYGHASHRNGQNALSKKFDFQKKLSSPVRKIQVLYSSNNFGGLNFFGRSFLWFSWA